jgi:hypothetical protein
MGNDLFRVGDLDNFRLSFGHDARGRVTKAIGLYDDGHRDENAKDGG